MEKVEKVTPVTTTQEKTTKKVHQKNLLHEPNSRFRRSFMANAENHPNSFDSCPSSDSRENCREKIGTVPYYDGVVREGEKERKRETQRCLLCAVSAIHLALYAVVIN